uniref:G-protein coupled receptors family 3 profile domain-containing protein n=1 Tax=Naja naja TaxID=35670 RepID=A0A8C6XKV9_NAJNA
ENTQLLPNVSLGFHILNSHFFCKMDLPFIGGPNSQVCLYMTNILSTYKIPQVSFIYGSFPVINDKTKDFFHQMFPNVTHHYMGILELLLHFKWNLFVQDILPIYSQKGICVDFLEKLPQISFSSHIAEKAIKWFETSRMVTGSTANTVIIQGEIHTISFLRSMFVFAQFYGVSVDSRVWIMTAQMDFASPGFIRDWDLHFLHGALSFAVHTNYPRGFQKFQKERNPLSENRDGFIHIFWKDAFNCDFSNSTLEEREEEICTGEEKLEILPGTVFDTRMSGHSYSIYNAVYIMAYALHAETSSKSKQRAKMKEIRQKGPHEQPWQLHKFLRNTYFKNTAGENISFDDNGHINAGFDIFNWQFFHGIYVLFTKIKYNHSMPVVPNQFFILFFSLIQKRPLSICNDNCNPGSSRAKIEGKPYCCYECLPCPEGRITNHKDMDDCLPCPEGQYPNNKHDLCLPKHITFLSYEDPLGISLAITAIFFACIATVILGIFIKYQDTPIVKANNRNITYLLLISLVLSFLCSLLFIGQPEKMTCLFQQPAFGIVFSIAISCILAKTIIVVLVFMASVPGSKMKRWLRKQLDNSIIVSCSLIQVIACTVWLITSPPYPDADMNLLAEEIILGCNEGSTLMFYCVLLYLLFLAIIGFSVTKFIFFSLLCFCSVWLLFFPTYLSTKGKYMVAVEIFSILSSSAGLLGCICFPKCFIILLRPDLNNKRHDGHKYELVSKHLNFDHMIMGILQKS